MGSFPETYNDPKGKLGRVWKAPSSSPPPPPRPACWIRSSSFVFKSSTIFVGSQLGYLTLFVMLDLDGFLQSLICLALLAR